MSSRRSLWPLVLLLLILASILLQQNRTLLSIRSTAVDILAPLQEVTGSFSRASQDLLGSLRQAQASNLENQNLRKTVEALRRENVELWETMAQQQKAMEQLGYQKANPNWNYLSARVVAWDPSNIIRTAAVDKGRVDGLELGMVVVSPGGLVGKVMEAGDRWSRVLLITDPRSSVNGMLQGTESRPKGILQGRSDGLLNMKYLPTDDTVHVGDAVVTSGLGGGFPPGLFVGWVLEASFGDGQMFQEALVRPASGLNDLSDVMILTNFTPVSVD